MKLLLLVTLIVCLGVQSTPSFSSISDKTQIAFISDRDGNTEIYVMQSDGSMQIPLTDLDSRIFDLAWSPNGQQLAFSADYQSKKAEIYLVDVPCEQITIGCLSTPINLTNTISDDVEPAWSSDGSKIAFGSGSDNFLWNIFIIHLQDSRLTSLADDFNDFAPTWSPDGSQIAVQSLRDDNWDIYILNIDGSEPVRLTDHDALDYSPKWSPDGSRIAFTSNRDGNWDIYVSDLSCDGLISDCTLNLTNHEAGDGGAAWSPDSSRIAFISNRDGNFEIYTMNADGSDVVRLTNNEFRDVAPVWRIFAE